MISHIIFIISTIAAFGLLTYSFMRIFKIIKLLKSPYSISNIGERLKRLFTVAVAQEKILRFPLIGLMHALVFWGFLMITFGSGEMLIDGIIGSPFDTNPLNDRVFKFTGIVYNFLIAGGDIFAYTILILDGAFLIRRLYLKIKRFTGTEMRHRDHKDAAFALTLILLLMVSLIGMNIAYNTGGESHFGSYPISSMLTGIFSGMNPGTIHTFEITFWWTHILMIFFFANYLPYSKHFHVFMSLPNVYFSRTEPLTKMNEMESVTGEVKLMLDPSLPEPQSSGEPARFGMKDTEDGTWKFYIDSLTCTQCGRCTSVCPANQTGKKLSPRKIVLDYRRRMEEKMTGLLKEGKKYDDGKSLLGDYTTAEELWACTTCNACAQECPVSIDQPSMILEMRRFIFMEQSAAPSLLNSMCTNIENNGAPWQYSAADRAKWTENITQNDEEKTPVKVPLMSEISAAGKTIDILFWVGSASSYDDRAKKISRDFAKILNHTKINYAILGSEETDSGDNAKRAGNEFLFQMQALTNIEVLNSYGIKKIVTCDPHDFNTLKNEYSDLGGKYEVFHHSQFLDELIKRNIIKINGNPLAGKNVTFHDPCYLGRGNGEYNAPRNILTSVSCNLTEMHRNKSRALCCGAGGTQMFKESEAGNKEVYELRTEDALNVKPNIIATACPLCMTMLTDGIKMKELSGEVQVLDIAEILVKALSL
jgi:Fe-S oxidoreductase